MLDQITSFTEFYKQTHKGHVLNWDHSLGNATVSARFNCGKKELLVSLYQAVVLVLFNDADELMFNDIKTMTSMGQSPSLPFTSLPSKKGKTKKLKQ
jgi:cullin-4